VIYFRLGIITFRKKAAEYLMEYEMSKYRQKQIRTWNLPQVVGTEYD